MNKILVLAEKPSVGRDLARVLKCSKKGNGYLEGDSYIVTWALGHLVTLADPEKYDVKYKSWQMEDLPMLPANLKLDVIAKTSKQFHAVKAQMLRLDVKDIIIATDAGREGELVARWIIEKAAVKKPIKRLWISSVTDQAIRNGFNSLKPGAQYNNLYSAAVARAEADWYVGLNATRALTCKYNAQLSCGRVQTPTLAIIAGREREIQNFKPVDYYGITAAVNGFTLTWHDAQTNEARSFDKAKCERILKETDHHKCEVVSMTKTPKKTYSPKLYDLTELQRDANKFFGFSAKDTLSIMQALYERHKVLTYPRTDSRYITTDLVPTLKDRLKACSIGNYAKFTRKLLLSPIMGNSSFVDNSKVSDHHAIIPTEETVLLSNLSDKEFKIYDLVVKRFLAVLYPPFEFTAVTIKSKIGKEFFFAKGKIVQEDGWKAVYGNTVEDEGDGTDQRLPEVKQGDVLPLVSLEMTHGKTKPPSPFNEATLLTAMESPAKYANSQNSELMKTLGETGGLGTVATRADIIEKLFDSFLIEKRNNTIYMTSKGFQLLELVPEELKSPLLTAKWEQNLGYISKGTLNKNTFIDEMKAYTQKIVLDIKNSTDQFKHNNLTGNKCPECGKFMLEVNGKKGKMLVCQDRDCGYRKSEVIVTNARCPNCHKKLELRGSGEGQIFFCKCGHKEKLTAFNERRKGSNQNVSKTDVSKYLNQQNKKEEPIVNSAFADLLNKLK
ncbi:MAG: DNA topoisomerase III [Firmicutes bacterium HGW-Firmicutes-1]|jgi:DNA topoisomerase-3|nr:MAG: DNA topoisomerase III [Firmicutes bacterium HGW-Firmicutes-1]